MSFLHRRRIRARRLSLYLASKSRVPRSLHSLSTSLPLSPRIANLVRITVCILPGLLFLMDSLAIELSGLIELPESCLLALVAAMFSRPRSGVASTHLGPH